MVQKQHIFKGLFVVLAIVLSSFTLAFGQEEADVEPNDTCLTAQDLGAVTLPFTLSGNLDITSDPYPAPVTRTPYVTPTPTPPLGGSLNSLADTSDVDFFQFAGTPGEFVRVDLEGWDTDAGTLYDPYAGVFDSDCSLISSNDDSGVGASALLLFHIPDDGVFVLAATSYGDRDFSGHGYSGGSYQLSISSAVAAGAVTGRVIDAETGAALTGDEWPLFVDLYRCRDGECSDWVNFQPTDSEGRFGFYVDYEGNALTPGTYQVAVYSQAYEQYTTEPFEMGEEQDVDLGDLALEPLPLAGAIRGRVVDADTGDPLPGDTAFYASVELFACADDNCHEWVSYQYPDGEGRFEFDADSMRRPLIAGTYQVVVYAYPYEEYTTEPFEIGEGQDVDLGDLAVEPTPLLGSISGRIVDADTENPLPGDAPPHAVVDLYLCVDGRCDVWMSTQNVDEEGRFRFETHYYGYPLEPGTYRIEVYADLYEEYQSEPFEVGEDEDLDLGDITLTPLPLVGSISGRVVDAFTGEPLPGNGRFYVSVDLYRCVDGHCDEWMDYQYPDDEGRFRFEVGYYGRPLVAGTYQVRVYAEGYRQSRTEPFDVAESDDWDLGDVQLTPIPLSFTGATPCTDLPSEGGTCRFSVTVVNRWPTSIEAAAWSIVDGYELGAFNYHTAFQIGAPQPVNIESAGEAVFSFEFNVPEMVADGASFCPKVLAGQEPEPLYNPIAVDYPFCVYKGTNGFMTMTGEQARELIQRQGDSPRPDVHRARWHGRPDIRGVPRRPEQQPALRPAPRRLHPADAKAGRPEKANRKFPPAGVN